MSLLQQMVCNSPKPDMGKAFIFPETILDKDSNKTTEEDSVSKEQSLVPDPNSRTSLQKSSNPTGNAGLVNLGLMMGVVALLKLILGLFINIADDVIPIVTLVPSVANLSLIVILFPVIATLITFRVELLISQHKVSWENALPCHVATISTVLAIPVVTLRRQDNLDHLITNLLVCLSSIILAMKLISYIQVNKRFRERQVISNNNEEQGYPGNLNLGNLVRFWLAPTLVYQPNTGHCSSIKLQVVLRRLMELCVLQVLVRQVMLAIPSVVSGLLTAVENEEKLLIVERFFTLSLAFNFVWMLSFYLLFVSFLQLTAEMSQSHERLFFHSWWNASSLEEFWRWWNLPVHRWCVKHIYVPLVKNNFSKSNAMLAVFITSALLHEYLISCPLQIAGHFAFVGFLGQLPLIKISEVVQSKCGGKVGNLLVWAVLVFGNSSGVVVYYKEVVGVY